jgi:hypothetical protein
VRLSVRRRIDYGIAEIIVRNKESPSMLDELSAKQRMKANY